MFSIFYLVHNMCENSIDDYMNPKWGILDYFVEQKRLGRIRHLGFSCHGSSELLAKVLKSAVANAENNHEMNPDALYVSETYANPGPVLKRGMPRARGGYARVLKRTSHITVVVKEKE